MNCLICGKKLKKDKTDLFHYTGCGLSKVYLKGIKHIKCTNLECGEEEIIILNIEELHRTIANELSIQKNKLLPEEIKYLRTFLGFSGTDFSKKIGVSPETVTRWEKGQINMKESVERLLRVLVLSNSAPFQDYDELETFATIQRRTPIRREFKIDQRKWSATAS